MRSFARHCEEGSGDAVAHSMIVNVENLAQAGVHPARPRPGELLQVIQADPPLGKDLRRNYIKTYLEKSYL